VAGEDFVHVQLSAAGVKRAGPGGQLRITAGRNSSFVFQVGQSLRVTRAYEWNVLLKQEQFEGQPIVELATATSTVSATTAVKPYVAPVTDPVGSHASALPAGQHPAMELGIEVFGIQHHPPIAAKEK
jgi:hypothetical protein